MGLKMKVAWAALTLASVLMPEAKQAPSKSSNGDLKEIKCKPDEIALLMGWGSMKCFKKGPPLLPCHSNNIESTECEELCKLHANNNKDVQKDTWLHQERPAGSVKTRGKAK